MSKSHLSGRFLQLKFQNIKGKFDILGNEIEDNIAQFEHSKKAVCIDTPHENLFGFRGCFSKYFTHSYQ